MDDLHLNPPTVREAPDGVEFNLSRAKVPNHATDQTDSFPLDFDAKALRSKRLESVRDMMRENDLGAVLLFDPNNQRYATGSRNMFGYFLRNSTRYIYIPQSGDVILFEYPGSAHISTWLETIQDSRTSKIVFAAVNGRDRLVAKPFAEEIANARGLWWEPTGGNGSLYTRSCSRVGSRGAGGRGLYADDSAYTTSQTARRDRLPLTEHVGRRDRGLECGEETRTWSQ